MSKHVKKVAVFVLVMFPLAFSVGCDTQKKTNTLAGAGVGALAGQAIGSSTGATLIGAGVGAVAGNVLTKEDK
jgi:outer membrane lipoprotein SlyB